MSRFITNILLLCVFFFGGAFYGTYQKEQIVHEIIPTEDTTEIMTIQVDEVESEPMPKEKQEHFIDHMAQFLEKMVINLYEIIIKIMYTIANLFF